MFENMNDDDDDAFFTPISSSNLASLFGVNVTLANSSLAKTTLTYTAPKQPVTKTDESARSSPAKHQSSVLLFKEVHAFKLIEKQYTTQGKCGLALIGNESVHIYQLLLYKQKNDIISTSKVYNIFQFIMQKDNYASYCDDQKHNWTVRFNSESDMNEFVYALESKGVKIINNIKNVETLKVKEIDVPKVDLFKEGTITDNSETVKHLDSDNQSDSSSSNAKANILSRMAKMGQRILLPNTSVSDGTDSDTEKDKSLNNKVNRKSKRVTPVSPVTSTNVSELPKQEITVVPNTALATVTAPVRQTTTAQQYALINGQYVPILQPHYLPVSSDIAPVCQAVLPASEAVNSPVLYTPTAQVPSEQMSMYFVENRTHNSEVRMNIMRLTNKMEEMMDKVNKLDINAVKTTSNVSSNDEILKENETLKSTISMLEKSILDLKQHECDTKNQDELVERESVLLREKEEQNKLLAELREKENDHVKRIEKLQQQVDEQSQTIINLVESLQESEVKNNSELLLNKEKFLNINDTIKKIMNVLYQEVCSQFSDDETVQGKDVKRVLAQKIVDNTYSIIAIVKELKMPDTNVTISE